MQGTAGGLTLEAAECPFVLRNTLRVGADVMPRFQALLWRAQCHTGHNLVLLHTQVLRLWFSGAYSVGGW